MLHPQPSRRATTPRPVMKWAVNHGGGQMRRMVVTLIALLLSFLPFAGTANAATVNYPELGTVEQPLVMKVRPNVTASAVFVVKIKDREHRKTISQLDNCVGFTCRPMKPPKMQRTSWGWVLRLTQRIGPLDKVTIDRFRYAYPWGAPSYWFIKTSQKFSQHGTTGWVWVESKIKYTVDFL